MVNIAGKVVSFSPMSHKKTKFISMAVCLFANLFQTIAFMFPRCPRVWCVFALFDITEFGLTSRWYHTVWEIVWLRDFFLTFVISTI